MRLVFEYEKYESMKKPWMKEGILKMKCWRPGGLNSEGATDF